MSSKSIGNKVTIKDDKKKEIIKKTLQANIDALKDPKIMKVPVKEQEDNQQITTFTDPTLYRSFKGHKGAVLSSVFNKTKKQLVTSSEDCNLVVWNFNPNLKPYKFIGHKGSVNDVAISVNGEIILSASSDETVRVWLNTNDGTSQTLRLHDAPIKTVDISYDTKLILSGADDKLIKVTSLMNQKTLYSLSNHNDFINCARFSPDSRLICSSSNDNTVKLFDVNTKNLFHNFDDNIYPVNNVRFHPDGTCVTTAGTNREVNVYDIRSKRVIQKYKGHSDAVTCATFHPTGSYVVSTSNDSTIKIWDCRKEKLMYTLFGHKGSSNTVDFSNCGNYFCSGGEDSMVMIWKSNVYCIDNDDEGITQPMQNFSKTEQVEMDKFKNLPEELASTFEKFVHQMDLIVKSFQSLDYRVGKIEDKIQDIEMIKKSLHEKSLENSKNILASLKYNDKTETISGFQDNEAPFQGSKDLEIGPNVNNFVDTYNIQDRNNFDDNDDNVFNQNIYEGEVEAEVGVNRPDEDIF